jgi:hypothetical protein
MTTDAGSGFDDRAAGRDTGDDRLEEATHHLPDDDIGDDPVLEEARERKQAEDQVDDAF